MASDIKGNREVITAETGVLCSPKQPADYARALHRLIGDQAARASMGRAALQRARAQFCLDRLHREVTQVYEELLIRHRG